MERRGVGTGLTVVQVEALATVGHAGVGALAEVEAAPAGGALVTAAAHARLAERRALLAALAVVAEKSTGTLRHTHPGERERQQGSWGSGVRGHLHVTLIKHIDIHTFCLHFI